MSEGGRRGAGTEGGRELGHCHHSLSPGPGFSADVYHIFSTALIIFSVFRSSFLLTIRQYFLSRFARNPFSTQTHKLLSSCRISQSK
jgi:hypothetical protein